MVDDPNPPQGTETDPGPTPAADADAAAVADSAKKKQLDIPEGRLPESFDFHHKVFWSMEGAYFCVSEQTEEPVFKINLGGNEVALTLAGIRKEFKIEPGCHDDLLLRLVEAGLNYVQGLRPGDPVPPELTTGAASWTPSDRDMRVAHQRLTVQLVSWLTGQEHMYTDPEQLLQLAEDPAIKKFIAEAFTEAAEKIGLGRDRREDVVKYLEVLAQELAYIETMRRMFLQVQEMEKKIQGLRRLYGAERSVMEVADPVARLARTAVEGFKHSFDEIDAQTSEILAMLKNIDAQVGYIREARDDLHRRLMPWENMLQRWKPVKVKQEQSVPDLLRITYHFLAPRFMSVNEWVLVTKPRRPDELGVSQLSKDNKPKSKGKVMVWG